MMFPEPLWKEDVELLIELRDLEQGRDWSGLEVCAKQVLADCPISVNALMALGKALEKQGKENEAIECYENAIAVLRPRRKPHAHFMNRLDIFYRRLKKYEDCFQLCLFYIDTHSYSPDALHRLARAANLVGKNELGDVAKALGARVSEPVRPRGADEPLPPVPDKIEYTEEDIRRASELWDKLIPEFAGMLDAESVTGDVDDLEEPPEFVEEATPLRLEAEPRPRYSNEDVERISRELSERLRVYDRRPAVSSA